MTLALCRWCGKIENEHRAYRPGEPLLMDPLRVCRGLTMHFLPQREGQGIAVPDRDGYATHRVELRLCEACLSGIGKVCHTPDCALCRHDAPGFRIMVELYEVLDD